MGGGSKLEQLTYLLKNGKKVRYREISRASISPVTGSTKKQNKQGQKGRDPTPGSFLEHDFYFS
jgi:hypothetical protein